MTTTVGSGEPATDANKGANTVERRNRKFLSVFVALAAAGVVAMGLNASLGGFNATVTNPTSSFSSGTLLLNEANGTTSCSSTTTGSPIRSNDNRNCTIDLLGDPTNAVPGVTSPVRTITLTNNGSVDASSLTMTASACSAKTNASLAGNDTANFCGKVDVTIAIGSGSSATCAFGTPATSGGGCAVPSSSATLASLDTGPIALDALNTGKSETLTITEVLDSSATNADQGLTATVPVSFELAQ